MKHLWRQAAVLFATTAAFVGCSKQPAGLVAGQAPGSLSFKVKERFGIDTNMNKDDGKPAEISGLAVSPDGKRALVMGVANKGNVQVWDLETHKKLFEYDNPTASRLAIAISPDGIVGAYPKQWEGSIALIDLATGKELRQLKKTRRIRLYEIMEGLSFSPDGALVVVASRKEIIGWNPATGDQVFLWKESATVSALSGFFDGGKKIAAGTEKGSVKVWDVVKGEPVQTLADAGGEVQHLFASENGTLLGACEQFGPIKIWDLRTGKVVNELQEDHSIFGSMLFLHDNRTMLYNGNWDLVLQDTVSGEKKTIVENDKVHQRPLTATPDGSVLLSSEEYGKIRVWDVKSSR